jgi:predicted dehydrogenase
VSKRAVIIGFGSIGKRHFNILKNMGFEVDTIDVDEISRAEEILKNNEYDIGLVCTPNSLHLDHCLLLASFGIPFFCEKPLYVEKNMNKWSTLVTLVNEMGLTNMIGCNLRFEPSVDKIKRQYTDSVVSVISRFGYDLKKWHNDGKHLQSYSANKHMHGGITFDCIHEFDYLLYWFGEVESMELVQEKRTDVTVDTEDYVSGKILFKNGVTATIELDYIEEEYTRFFELNMSDGTVIRSNLNPTNEDYVREISYFVDKVKKGEKCMNDIYQASQLIDSINAGIKVRV